MTYIVSPLAGLGEGISWRPPAYILFLLILSVFDLSGIVHQLLYISYFLRALFNFHATMF